MYPKKQPKSDREKFYGAFQKKVGCKPEQYLRRKLAGGMPEAELRRTHGATHRTDRRAQGKEILGLLQLPGLSVYEGL